MKKDKKTGMYKIFIAILASIFASGIYLLSTPKCPVCGGEHVVHNYFKAVGIRASNQNNFYYAMITYEDMINQLGEPKETIQVDNRLGQDIPEGYSYILYKYDKIGFYYYESIEGGENNRVFDCMQIYSPDVELRSMIHVNSSRWIIALAYRNCMSEKVRFPKNAVLYYDVPKDPSYLWCRAVLFEYDLLGRAKCISYFFSWK